MLAQFSWEAVICQFWKYQNPPGEGPEQPALADPAWAGRIGQDNLEKCLPASATLLLCRRCKETFSKVRQVLPSWKSKVALNRSDVNHFKYNLLKKRSRAVLQDDRNAICIL